ncbi:MAG: protealysin inhibitor emfourin [Steroidobacteraceae bacterium]
MSRGGCQLVYRREGGFAGLRRGCELDSARLPPADAAQFERLVDAALPALARLPSQRARLQGADAISRRLELRRGTQHAAVVGDDALTDEIAALLAFLEARSGPLD